MIRLNLFMIWFLHFLSLLSVICRCCCQNLLNRINAVLVYTVSTLFSLFCQLFTLADDNDITLKSIRTQDINQQLRDYIQKMEDEK